MSIEKILAFAVGPILMIGLVLFFVFSDKPVKEEKKDGQVQETVGETKKEKKASKKIINGLKKELTDLTSEMGKKDTVIDSLKKVLAQKETDSNDRESEIEKLTEQLSENRNIEKNAIDLAKTFASMKSEQMAPILQKLDDKTVTLIYKNMSTRVRKNFLLALSSQRAAKLTKTMAGI